MFSSRLEQRRKARRFALLVAAAVLLIGIVLIAIVAVRGFDLLNAADADMMPMVLGVLGALAGLLVLCLAAYVAARILTRVS